MLHGKFSIGAPSMHLERHRGLGARAASDSGRAPVNRAAAVLGRGVNLPHARLKRYAAVHVSVMLAAGIVRSCEHRFGVVKPVR